MLVTNNVALRFMSILTPPCKFSATLFLPDNAFLADLDDESSSLGQASRSSDELIYIEDSQDRLPDAPSQLDLKTPAAMRAIVGSCKPIKPAQISNGKPERTLQVLKGHYHSC